METPPNKPKRPIKWRKVDIPSSSSLPLTSQPQLAKTSQPKLTPIQQAKKKEKKIKPDTQQELFPKPPIPKEKTQNQTTQTNTTSQTKKIENFSKKQKKKKNKSLDGVPKSSTHTTPTVVKNNQRNINQHSNHDKEEKLNNKISSVIEQALNSLKEKEVQILKKKQHLISTYDYESYLEEAQIFIRDLEIIKLQVKTFTERTRHILETNTTSLVEKLKAIEIECKRITVNRLPIYAIRNEILQLLDKNDVIICNCSAGNGKSTQIPQYLLEHGYNSIVCTQPRKLTCMTLANRISEELGDKNIVGCKIGEGRNKKKKNTKINFVTDRGLLNEYQKDQLLSSYSFILVDEAHERSIYTDILLSLLKDCVKRRRKLNNPLKLLIASATINEILFSNFFDDCPIKKLEHQSYPVAEYFCSSRESNICEQATRKVTDIVKKNLHQGDILVFLSSLDEITQCCKLAKNSLGGSCKIIPLHGKIGNISMNKIFNQSKPIRKIIFSTNVAETSITIPSVRIVIDSGQMRQVFYDNEKNMTIIKTISISQSCAMQRKGRVGRMSSGVCYRLYSQADYQRMKMTSEAEILRSHLGISILQILSCGVTDITKFELLEMPSTESIIKELNSLERLGFTREGQITEQGLMACTLQMEPTLSRMIIQARLKGVEELMASIVAMMNISDILFKRSQTKTLSQTIFSSDYGDLFSLLQIFQQFSKQSNKEDWCLANNISIQYLKHAESALKDIRNRIRFFKKTKHQSNSHTSKDELLRMAIVESHYQNLAYFDGFLPNMTKVYYIPSLKQPAFIHSSSSLSIGDPKPFILFSELIRTDKLFMKNITPIDLGEIQKLYPQLDTNMIANKVKSECRVSLPTIISQILKFRNTEIIEEVETQLGHVIEIDSTDSSIKVYCDKNERPVVISKIQKVIEVAKKRALSEVLEHDCGNGLRIMIGSGCKVHGLIFPNEFTKIQVNNLPLGVDDDYLRRLFEPYQAIDFRVFKSLPNDSFSSGYVIFKDYSIATKVYHKCKETLKLTPVLSNTKSTSESTLVKLKWSIGANNGKCFICFGSGDNGRTINTIIIDRRLAFILGRGVKFNVRKMKNKDVLEIRGIHEYIDVRYMKQLLNERNIEYKFVIVPRIAGIDEEMHQISLLSKVQSFRSLEFLDILEIDNRKQLGTAWACFSDRMDADLVVETLNASQFMRGMIWASCTHRETLIVPKEVTEILKLEIERLQAESKCKIKIYSTNRRNNSSENFKSEVTIQSPDLENFNEAKMQVLSLLKPLSLHLSYQTIQYANRKRKQIISIENRNNVHISINSKTRTIEIYGRTFDKQQSRSELLELLKDKSRTLTISIKYLKAIIGDGGKPLRELQAKYPGCDISLNVKAKQILIEGKESEQLEIQQYVLDLFANYEQNHNFEHSDHDCPICFERMMNPFRIIGCSHEVCQDCFSFQIQNPKSFVCPCCDIALSISEILLYLETMQEETFLKALESFLMENPQSYKYCPKNCGSVCKVIDTDIVCHKCKTTFCKDCEQKAHHGLSCGERDRTREWILQNTKPCPKCSQRIEKSSGCNHMTCNYCGEHFCWLCLEGFGSAAATYAHFTRSNCNTFDIPVEIERPPNNNPVIVQQQNQANPRIVQRQEIPIIRPLPNNPIPQQNNPPNNAIPPQQNNPPPPPQQNQRQGLLNCIVM